MKLTKHAWTLWALVLIIFLAPALLIPFTRNAVYYIALGACIAMFGVTAATFFRAFRRNASIESKLLGWPIFRVACTALAVQLIVGFALMALAGHCPVWAAVLTEILVFAVSFIVLTTKDAAREAVSVNEEQIPDTTAGWKVIRGKAAALAAMRPDPGMKRLADAIRYADPTPSALDAQILDNLTQMETAADSAFSALLEQTTRLVTARRQG